MAELLGTSSGFVNSLAFVLPHEWVWPLPLYELALMTAARARSMNLMPQITFITSEGRPLKAFGQAGCDAVVKSPWRTPGSHFALGSSPKCQPPACSG